MAFAEISAQRASSAASGSSLTKSVAYPGNVGVGNLLVLGGSYEMATTTAPFITATGAGAPLASTWVVQRSWYAQSLNGTWIAYAPAGANGACTVTVNWMTVGAATGSSYGTFSITEFTGFGGQTSSLQALGSSTSPAPGTLHVTDTDLILGAVTFRGTTTVTAPAGWTQIGEQETFGTDVTHQFAYKIATATGTEAPVWTLGASNLWVAQAIGLSLVGTVTPGGSGGFTGGLGGYGAAGTIGVGGY